MNQISFEGQLSLQDFKLKTLQLGNPDSVREILPLKIKNAFEVKKLTWKDFIGKPIENSYWLAHVYWSIKYSCQKVEVQQPQREGFLIRQDQSQKQQQLPPKPRINARISQNSPSVQKKYSKNSTPRKSSQDQKNTSNLTRSASNQSLKEQTKFRYTVTVLTNLLEKSWTKLDDEDYLLEHETGHYLIGCLCALEFKRQAESRSFDTEVQIKALFQTIFREFLSIEKNYDEETAHYLNQEMQAAWNTKIKEQLLLYQAYFSQLK